jgi:Tol biopolymer transport system component
MKTKRVLVLAGFGALTILSTLTGLAAGAANDLTLISRASGVAGVAGQSDSLHPSSSADGRYIAFESGAANLDSDNNPAVQDVFVRDTQASTTTLVSRATGAAGVGGDQGSSFASISADGRYVVFESDADNLDADSNDAVLDVFVRDTQANTTTLVSRAAGVAGAVGGDRSENASISADGRYVAFQSDADNLDPDSNDAKSDVFVRDTQANTTTLVSRAAGVAGTVGDDNSRVPSISGDGRYVAFDSFADNLDAESNDAFNNVFVRDTQANTTTLVSRAAGPAGAVGDSHSGIPAIAGDGRYVAFESLADNLDSDGNDSVSDIYVRDTQAGTTTLASRATGAAGAAGDGNSNGASISADGRQVAFRSAADNLDSDSSDGVDDVFARDTQANSTTLLSRAAGATGTIGDDVSFEPSISADGMFVAFTSNADQLDPDSNDAFLDIFLRELGPAAAIPPEGGGQPGGGSTPIAIPAGVTPFNLDAALKKCRKRFQGQGKARKKKLKNCIKNARKHASGR